jgi:hypothetical protein
MNFKLIIGVVALLMATACVKPNNKDQIAERARIEGQEQAEAQFSKQMSEKDALVERAREEGRAQAEEEMKVQIENQAKLVERARAEGRAQAEEELHIQNGSLNSKANKMEQDLQRRQMFYTAASGTYEGSIGTEHGNFNIRVTLISNLPAFPVDRVRQLDEISSDINNLYFNAQIVQWSPDNNLSAVGCRVNNIRPDLINGVISIASTECPNLYILKISNARATAGTTTAASKSVATKIYSGKVKAVSALVGEVRPTTNASVYELFANRKGN